MTFDPIEDPDATQGCFTADSENCIGVATTTRLVPLLGRWLDAPVCQACAEKLDGYYEAQDQQNVHDFYGSAGERR